MRDWIIERAMEPAEADGFRAALARACAESLEEGTVGHGAERAEVDRSIRVSRVAFPDVAHPDLAGTFSRLRERVLRANRERFGFDLAGPGPAQGPAQGPGRGETATESPTRIEWQYTQYTRGGDYYRQHCDCAYLRDGDGDGGTDGAAQPGARPGRMRKLSGSLILSDPRTCRGGRFSFATGVSQVAREIEQGEMLVFASFLPHAVSPILQGVRESLVFWAWGPDFR